VRDNTNALYGAVRRLAYIERTSNYQTTATTVATAPNMFSSNLTFTADGVSSYLVVFFSGSSMSHSGASGLISVFLTDGGNNALGRLSFHQQSGADERQNGAIHQRYYTPTAGSQSLNVRAHTNSATLTMLMNNGVGENDVPGFLAIYGPALT
jgi:hypothetical protein